MAYEQLKSVLERFRSDPAYMKTKEGLIDMACRDCAFWKEDERDYECGALGVLRLLVERGIVTPEGIERALDR